MNELGAKHWLGVAEQVNEATAKATPDIYLPTTSIAVKRGPSNIERKTSNASGRKLAPRLGLFKPEGKANCELMAEQPHIMRWLAGASATTQPDPTNAPTAYTNTVTGWSDQPLPLSIIASRVYDSVRQTGCYIGKVKLSGQAGEQGTRDVEWMGITHTDGYTEALVPTFPTKVLTMLDVAIELDDAESLIVPEVEVEFDGGMEQLAVLERSGGPKRIRRKEPPSIKGKLKFIDYPVSEYNKLKAATSFKLMFEFQGSLIAGAIYNLDRYTFPKCVYDGGLDDEIESDVITGEANFEAFYDEALDYDFLFENQSTVDLSALPV